jgi:hypothetical protein
LSKSRIRVQRLPTAPRRGARRAPGPTVVRARLHHSSADLDTDAALPLYYVSCGAGPVTPMKTVVPAVSEDHVVEDADAEELSGVA